MEWAKLVSDIIHEKKPQMVLDFGVWRGYFSILAASYWAQVDAVNHDQDMKIYPEYLKNHPNIKFHDCHIRNFKLKNNYDLVIVKNIIMYLEKERIISDFLNKLYDKLNRWWIVFLTYHLPDSYLVRIGEIKVNYEINDFKKSGKNYILKDFGEYYNPVDNVRNENHHISYIVLQK